MKNLKLWDIESGECLNTLVGHLEGVILLKFQMKKYVASRKIT